MWDRGDKLRRRILRDYGSWDYWQHRLAGREDIPLEAREAGLVGLGDLRRVLGEGWLAQAVKTRHPFLRMLLNEAPWTRFWIRNFATILTTLEHTPGFRKLLHRLKRAEHYEAAFAEADLAYRVVSAGFAMELSAPSEGHEPDIMIHSDPPITLEVAMLGTAQEWRLGEETLMTLTLPALADPEVVTGGMIHEILPKKLLASYQSQIREAVAQVKATGQPAEIHDPGIIDFYIAPRSNRALVEQWEKEGKVLQTTGPPLSVSQVFRVSRMVERKARQVPPDSVGIVALYYGRTPFDPPRKILVHYVAEVIGQFDHIVAAALITRTFDPSFAGSTVETTDYGLLIAQRGQHFSREEVLIVLNDRSKLQLHQDLLARLFLLPPNAGSPESLATHGSL